MGEKCGWLFSYTDGLSSSLETLCAGSSDISSAIGVAGTLVGFVLSLEISSSISHCAYCSPIRMGAN